MGGGAHPYAFTEQGVAMLSSVLRSERAVAVNIEVIRAFVELRRIAASHANLEKRLEELERETAKKLGQHDKQLAQIFEALRQLIAPPQRLNPGPFGYASSTCQDGGGERVVNTEVAGSGHVWLYTLQPSDSKVQLCVRVQGAASVGGTLEVDATGIPGGDLPLIVSDDTGEEGAEPCPTSVFNLESPEHIRIARSATGAIPASVCVEVGSTTKRVTVDPESMPIPPRATWTPRSGNPRSTAALIVPHQPGP